MKKYIFFCGIIVLLVLNVACVNGTKMDVISFPVNATETVYCLDKDTLQDTDVYLTFDKKDNGTVVISSLITPIEYYMMGKLKIKNYKRFATSKFPDTTEFLCCLQESMAKASKKYPLDSLKYIYFDTFDFPDETVELSLAMDTVKPNRTDGRFFQMGKTSQFFVKSIWILQQLGYCSQRLSFES